jgi:hypothetical protein
VASCIGGAVLAAVALGRHRQRERSAVWIAEGYRALGSCREASGSYAIGIAVWIALIATVIGWDLNSFLQHAGAFPTLSYFTGKVTRLHWGRALLFAAWLALGGWLAAGWRTPRSAN